MNSQLGQAWLVASVDLGLRVAVPFVLTTEAHESVLYDAVVFGFGTKRGMLLMEQWDDAKARIAVEAGYGYSCMDVGPYDRESTIEVLREWGWAGSEAPSSWL